MFSGVFKVLLIIMIVFAVIINLVAFIAERVMKKRMSGLADKEKN